MKIPRNCLIEQCVIRQAGRLAIDHLYLDIETADGRRLGRLVATDGKALAVIFVEVDDGDVPGLVSTRALIAARELVGTRATVELHCGVLRLVTADGVSYPRPEGDYPKWRELIPSRAATTEITLDARVLSRLAAAMGTHAVRLTLGNPRQPLRVMPLDEDAPAADGVMMMIAPAVLPDEKQHCTAEDAEERRGIII